MHVIANSLLVVLNRYITEKKTCSKKAQKLLKIEPTAELVNHCLSMWFWQECTTAVPCLLSTPVPCAVQNEWKQISISNKHIPSSQMTCLIPFKSCMLGMSSNNAIKPEFQKKKCVSKFSEKKKNCSPPGFETTTSWMQVSCTYLCCGFWWRVFSTSSSSSSCRTQAGHCINSRWQTWSRKIMYSWC